MSNVQIPVKYKDVIVGYTEKTPILGLKIGVGRTKIVNFVVIY